MLSTDYSLFLLQPNQPKPLPFHNTLIMNVTFSGFEHNDTDNQVVLLSNDEFVLIVDDDPLIRAPIRIFFEENGLAVIEADSGQACLEILGLHGTGKVQALAEVAAALCLAGELSIVGALAAGEFTQAHQRLARNNRPPAKGPAR